ncbi:MAG: hypothetical protein ACR2KV_08120 [Solirubrobacteraceae bacterium]
MRATAAPDPDLILADALRGPSSDDAARSLAFWRARLERLPIHRVGARREARAMVAAWEERLRRAEFERVGGGLLGRLAAGISVLRGERPGAIVRRAVLLAVPRRVITGFVAVLLAVTVTFGVALGVVLARVL